MSKATSGRPGVELMKPLVVPGERPDLWSGADIGDDRIRALALGAYYAPLWNAYNDALSFEPGFPEDTETVREQAIDALNGAWGVTDADSARVTAQRLRAGQVHGDIYAIVHPLTLAALEVERADGDIAIRDEHEQFLRMCAQARGESQSRYVNHYGTWIQAQKLGVTQFGRALPRDAYAWDLTRGAFVVRASVSAGYLEDDEAWHLLESMLAAAQARYATWRQYGEGYLAGLAFWQARRDLADTKTAVTARRAALARQFIRPTSPWRRVELRPGTPCLTATPDQGRSPRVARAARAM